MENSSARLDALDGLRGFAAFYVVLHHMSTNRLLPAYPILLHGSMLVDTFFVISGFVMAYQYRARLDSVSSAASFVRRRFARIWPLHAAILCTMMIPRLVGLVLNGATGSPLFQAAGDHSLASWLASLTLLNGMGLYDYAVWNGPSWTVSVEFFAYLVFAAAALRGGRWLNSIALTIVIGASTILIAKGIYLAGPIQYSFLRCLVGFFCGVLAMAGYDFLATRHVLDKTKAIVVEGVFFALAILLLWFGSASTGLAFPPVCGILVAVLALGRSPLARLLSSRFFQRLGAWSLAMYLLHIPLLNALWSADSWTTYVDLHFRFGWGTRESIVFLVLVLGIAALAHNLLEKPARDWLGGRGRRVYVPTPASLPAVVSGEQLS
ncbi:acyltransferase [Bradyrhizobium sp. 150]|uniref:acyltransferase family protein n=1 Tax=Bradyrhizobium sp. 150 TaxID=2782625 RepID=UPI001FF95547|nr:acyltransferase [Bradyrhizobium sp. 150]MCK1675311.1 acyltransferase [Bradyrhizobium sp. 150]